VGEGTNCGCFPFHNALLFVFFIFFLPFSFHSVLTKMFHFGTWKTVERRRSVCYNKNNLAKAEEYNAKLGEMHEKCGFALCNRPNICE
jgi:hypothetical protein